MTPFLIPQDCSFPLPRLRLFTSVFRSRCHCCPALAKTLKLSKKKYRLILLTQGHVESQNHKVDSTGVRSLFENVWIVDPTTTDTKFTYFSRLAEALPANETFLSIGNRVSTDIREAKRVGGLTCWFRYGEHQNEALESPFDHADFQVDAHDKLILTCKL